MLKIGDFVILKDSIPEYNGELGEIIALGRRITVNFPRNKFSNFYGKALTLQTYSEYLEKCDPEIYNSPLYKAMSEQET